MTYTESLAEVISLEEYRVRNAQKEFLTGCPCGLSWRDHYVSGEYVECSEEGEEDLCY